MDVLIVDDEPLARARLQRLLEAEQAYRVIGMAANGLEALQLVQQLDPDLVLLDIQMPEDDGLQVAAQLQRMEDPPAVIFCTAHQQHALDAFGVNAVDYLLKPVRQENLLQALDKASRLNRVQRANLSRTQTATGSAADSSSGESRTHISARSSRGVERILLDEVFYFAADQKYVTVHHQRGETLIDDTLKELQDSLQGRFVRIHRNALVSLERIEAMEKAADGQFVVRLRGTDHQPVISRRHVAPLRELLSDL